MESNERAHLKPISLITYNVYLIPGILGNKAHQVCVRQDSRAVDIGKYLVDKDVILLQEMWGSNALSIQLPLESTHEILYKSYSPYSGYCSTIIDSLGFYYQRTGGLWNAFKKQFNILHSDRHTFTVSETKSQKGVIVNLLDVSSHWGPGKTLLVLNTHLDPTNNNFKYQQCTEISNFLLQTVSKLQPFFSLNQLKWTDCSVILCGDLNLDTRQEVYQDILNKVFEGSTDLCWEFNPNIDSNITYTGKNSLSGTNSGNTIIDHIISINKLTIDENTTIYFHKLKVLSVNIDTQNPNEEMSDHWPVNIQLIQ